MTSQARVAQTGMPVMSCLGPSPASSCILICFHYAGGSAQSFYPWRTACEGRCELAAAELPGRGRRQRAPFVTSIGEAAEQFALAHFPLLGRQTIFYGHSLGALLAFETARILQQRGLGGPSCLIVSSRAAPGSSLTRVGLPNLSDADLHYLGEIQGTPKILLENPALMEYAIPPLRSDSSDLIYDYAFQPGPVLDIPIEAIGGVDDKWAPLEALLDWRTSTNAAFRLRMIAGGHFAATSSPELICGNHGDISREAAKRREPRPAACPASQFDSLPENRHMVRRQPVFEAWIAETGQARLDLLEDILSDEEQARGRQFHRQELREQHVVAHALKRLCIAKRLGGLDPRELHFATQASGKPILLDALIDFNLSHSRGVCAVALSRLGPCGVDIEVRGAGRYLSPALLKTMTVKEQERILAAGDPYAAFVECWVVKEAYAKLTGLGLAEQFDKLCAEQVFDGSGSEFGNLREFFVAKAIRSLLHRGLRDGPERRNLAWEYPFRARRGL